MLCDIFPAYCTIYNTSDICTQSNTTWCGDCALGNVACVSSAVQKIKCLWLLTIGTFPYYKTGRTNEMPAPQKYKLLYISILYTNTYIREDTLCIRQVSPLFFWIYIITQSRWCVCQFRTL